MADRVGITLANISILKNGKAKAIKVSTLAKLCEALECQPGELLEYKKNRIKLWKRAVLEDVARNL